MYWRIGTKLLDVFLNVSLSFFWESSRERGEGGYDRVPLSRFMSGSGVFVPHCDGIREQRTKAPHPHKRSDARLAAAASCPRNLSSPHWTRARHPLIVTLPFFRIKPIPTPLFEQPPLLSFFFIPKLGSAFCLAFLCIKNEIPFYASTTGLSVFFFIPLALALCLAPWRAHF